ncbi:MAG: mechanosensitive ion channel [Acetivibrio sp.]
MYDRLGFLAKTVKETPEIGRFFGWLQRVLPTELEVKSFFAKIVAAFLCYIIGKRLVKWLKKLLEKVFKQSNMDEGVRKFLLSLIGISLNVFLVVIVIGILGVQTSSLAAVVGSAGLTIGLALQGSLSNFAGGVMILIMKPFRIGDYIIADATEGTVTSIDVFYTRLLTIDNRKVVIPNGGLSNSNIVNVTNEEVRRLDLIISVSYQCDIKKVKQILRELLESQSEILKEEPLDIYVDNFTNNGISMGLRMWTKKEDYWKLKWKLLEDIKESFDENKIVMPFNQLDVNMKGESIN